MIPPSPANDPFHCSTFVLIGLLRHESLSAQQQQLLRSRYYHYGDLDPIRRLNFHFGLALFDSAS